MSNSESTSIKRETIRHDEAAYWDALECQRQLLTVADIIVNDDCPLVVGVHGRWGRGKTSFMQSLRTLIEPGCRKDDPIELPPDVEQHRQRIMKNKKNSNDKPVNELPTVWFNPWEYQFEAEPILPLLDAIRNQQKGAWGKAGDAIKNIVTNPKLRFVGGLARNFAKMALPGWVGGLTDSMAETTTEITNTFSQFNELFAKSIDKMTEDVGGRMVIFIDDLDRCEAEYIVKILESLKLFLNNQHCVYVLGCATEPVIEALRKRFYSDGESPSNTDARAAGQRQARDYLEKIIQVPIALPPIYRHQLTPFIQSLHEGKYIDCGQCEGECKEQCLDLLHAYAQDNPRRVKRFLNWHHAQLREIEFASEAVKQAITPFTSSPAAMLKINIPF